MPNQLDKETRIQLGFYTIQDAAEYFAMPYQAMRTLIVAGTIPPPLRPFVVETTDGHVIRMASTKGFYSKDDLKTLKKLMESGKTTARRVTRPPKPKKRVIVDEDGSKLYGREEAGELLNVNKHTFKIYMDNRIFPAEPTHKSHHAFYWTATELNKLRQWFIDRGYYKKSGNRVPHKVKTVKADGERAVSYTHLRAHET